MYSYLIQKFTSISVNGNTDSIDLINSLSLDYKKWKLNIQETLNDFVSAGKSQKIYID